MSALATSYYAAILTEKQADILLMLLGIEETYPGVPRETKEISSFLTELREDPGFEIKYRGTSYSGVYSTLRAMQDRGLVYRDLYGRWWITRKGDSAWEKSF